MQKTVSEFAGAVQTGVAELKRRVVLAERAQARKAKTAAALAAKEAQDAEKAKAKATAAAVASARPTASPAITALIEHIPSFAV
eukprot:538822-Alexandrium_andersonii.AAC.1